MAGPNLSSDASFIESTVPNDERTGLLFNDTVTQSRLALKTNVNRILPLSFSLALAMAATAATTVFAYAVIICPDPKHCNDTDEERAYLRGVAIATGIANLCGILAVTPLQAVVRWNLKAGLFSWILARAASVCVTYIAIIYRSITIAFIGRVLEGLASDNLLHYNLNAIFVSSAADTKQISRLLGTSLSMYLTAMALSPTLAGFLPSFLWSFILALAIFVLSAVYLGVVPVALRPPQVTALTPRQATHSGLFSFHRPFVNFFRDRKLVLPGIALLLYNMTQAYLFSALMAYTTLEYSFTGKENGWLISIAASISALFLAFVLHGLPRLRKLAGTIMDTESDRESSTSATWDLICALLAMSSQWVGLLLITSITQSWQIFAIVPLLALGIAAPGFMKSYSIALAEDKEMAVASLATMEIVGALLSSLVLGSLQSFLGHASVFLAAAGLVGASSLSLFGSMFMQE